MTIEPGGKGLNQAMMVRRLGADVDGLLAVGDDLAARFGGEEFMILMPDATETGGRSLAERLRAIVANTPVPTAAGEVRLTVSIGCTVVRPDDSLDDLLRRSDSALYESKNTGRNKVSFA